MKSRMLLGLVVFAVAAMPASNSYAVDWKYCQKEIDKFCKRVKGKSDRKIYECLSEHDEHHDNGLSAECDKKAHTQYEIENGMTDPNDAKK